MGVECGMQEYLVQQWPANYCNRVEVTIQNDLDKAWPNYDKPSADKDFWKHEWNHHGRCSENVLNGVDYFQTTLNLKNKFDIFDILTKSEIKPDDKYYDVQRIRNAINRATGVYAKVICKNNDLLSEIAVRVD